MVDNLPIFPNSRPFTLDDTEWFYHYYIDNGFSPYVDIHPENLYVWLNIHNDLAISKSDGAIILSYTNALDKDNHNIIPLANPINDLVVKKIMSYLESISKPLEIREIPSIICNKLDQNQWRIDDDRDSFEYILDTDQQSKLEGKIFHHQRRRINYFEREHPSNTVEINFYKEFNDNLKQTFYHHIDSMPFNSNINSSQDNVIEPITIRKNLEYASIFNKKALEIRINGNVVSLVMFSYLDENTAAINHLKVDYSVQYIFQYTIYQLAKILKQEGINEMNVEQDLGISGLRIFKERLRPSRFLEKKIIRPRHL